MYPSSVQHPSTGFDELSAHSMMNRQPYWLVTSTIAICCWPQHQSPLLTSCSSSGSWTLQCELWAAQRSTPTRGLTHLLHTELHWFNVADQVTYQLVVMVCKCLYGQASDYLSWAVYSTSITQVAERQHRHSTSCFLLVIPRYQLGQQHGTRSMIICMNQTCILTAFLFK